MRPHRIASKDKELGGLVEGVALQGQSFIIHVFDDDYQRLLATEHATCSSILNATPSLLNQHGVPRSG